MIENNLEFVELHRLLRPILRVKPMDRIVREIGSILAVPAATPEDLVAQGKLRVVYYAFEVTIGHLQWFDGRGASIELQFRAPKKRFHGLLFDQTRRIVNDLKRICAAEIVDLRFRESRVQSHAWSRSFEAHLIYDSRAYKTDWNYARDSSPLLIAPDSNEQYCFVGFFFNGGGYERVGGKTLLREDWEANAQDVSTSIEEYGRAHVHEAEAVMERLEAFRDGPKDD